MCSNGPKMCSNGFLKCAQMDPKCVQMDPKCAQMDPKCFLWSQMALKDSVQNVSTQDLKFDSLQNWDNFLKIKIIY